MKYSSLFVATALTAALGAGSVLAQTSTAPRTTSPNATSTNSTASASSATNNGMFWTQDSANEWRTSKLKGLNVYNQNNEKLGDIDDILVDQSGQIKAVIIGVGGFLGLGEHNVAVPFKQLQFTYNTDNRNMAGNGTAPAGTSMPNQARNNAGNPSTTGTANTGLGSATTAGANNNASTASSTSPGLASNNAALGTSRNNGAPDRAVLNATKDQLKSAPEFKYRG